MTEPQRETTRLRDVLANLESLIVDDAGSAEHERIVREAKAIEERHRRSDRLELLGIELAPKAHEAVISGRGLTQTTSLTAVQRWIWRPDLNPILVLVGEPGCGKSVAAAWAAANYSDSVSWLSSEEVVRTFTGSFGDATKVQERVKRARLSIIDDVAIEGNATRLCAALIEILQKREQRKTLITTNLGLEAWKKRYPDPRLHSRLKNSFFVYDKGPDLRGQP
jgi:hypothetical protein